MLKLILCALAAAELTSAGPLFARQATSTAASRTSSSTAAAATATAASNVTLPPWDWTRNKMHGMALGNWLVLERWMDEQWFIDSSGNPEARDEWTWSQSLGDRKAAVLKQHWDSWITEADIKFIADHGFNHLRVPIGYWAFINQPSGTPYASMSGQLEQLTRILGLAAKYNLYVVVDLHGLPGSQNGEQPSGHIGYNNFYNSDMQAYADQTVDAAIQYMTTSPYRGVITAFAACNEPIFYNEAQFQTLQRYYERTYAKLSTLSNPIPMMFAPGKTQTPVLATWQGFINGKNPKLLILEDHPYVGRMWGTQDQTYMLNQVCERNKQYANYGVPVAITEWSVSTDIYNNPAWISRFFSTQARAWHQSAGGIFWSYRVNAYPNVTAFQQHENFTLYSFVHIANQVPLPRSGQTSEQYVLSLPDYCNIGNTTITYPSTVRSIQPSYTRAFTSGAAAATRI